MGLSTDFLIKFQVFEKQALDSDIFAGV